MNGSILDGRYRLIDRIAAGGMGEVWRGSDEMLGRPVAVKLLHASHAGDQQFRERFRAEARYASSLSNPGIARVFDYGEHSPLGGPYMVMELVNGEPLSAILERLGRLPPDTVLDIVAQAARALEIAHQAGIVHRDIKPGNLLIMADGTTKITDFGIAKASAERQAQLTATGIVMGTAMYVSPEQATGSSLTGSSDIYSLGVVAYECLAGRPPFVAEAPLAIAIMHKHDPPPPLPSDVPRAIADLVMSMLSKTPDGRPESAARLADQAERLLEARTAAGAGAVMTGEMARVPDFPTSLDVEATRVDSPVSDPSLYTRPLGGTGAQTDAYPMPDPFGHEDDYDYPESEPGRRRSRGVLAIIGVAVCAVAAVVAVMMTAHGSTSQQQPPTPAQTVHTPQPSASVVVPGASSAPTHDTPASKSTNLEVTPPPAAHTTAPATVEPTHEQIPTTAPAQPKSSSPATPQPSSSKSPCLLLC